MELGVFSNVKFRIVRALVRMKDLDEVEGVSVLKEEKKLG